MITRYSFGQKLDGLIIVGDLHFRLKTFEEKLTSFSLKNLGFLHVGDLAVCKHNLKTGELDELNDYLKSTNNVLFSIRGNHDDREYFEKGLKLSNIILLKDYTVLTLEINNTMKNIFCLGGAISVDRKKLIVEGNYFLGEGVHFYDDNTFLNELIDLNLIISHIGPTFGHPFGFGPIVYEYSEHDVNLMWELTDERTKFTKIINLLLTNNKQIEAMFYGHYHFPYKIDYNGVNLQLLNKEELAQLY